MTLENKIALLLPEKWEPIKSLKNGDPRREGVNYAIDQCATNLKQAFEEGKIVFVDKKILDYLLDNHTEINMSNYGQDEVYELNHWSLYAYRYLLSLLTKGKDNA